MEPYSLASNLAELKFIEVTRENLTENINATVI